MNLLKREHWWIWLIIILISGGAGGIFLGILLGAYDKKAWYNNYKYWLIGFLCFFFPFTIMALVFELEMTAFAAAKLDVPGKEIYLSPYIWLLCMIVPILGWAMLIVMILYITIWPIVMISKGNAEKYLKKV